MIRDDRAVSTVIDVTLCLLFVSAAVAAPLVYHETATDDPGPRLGDRTAETVASTTVSLQYSLEPLVSDYEDEDGHFDGRYDERRAKRSVHGSIAGLLANAARTNLRLDGEPITHSGDFEERLEATAIGSLLGANDDVYVVARWEPYADASLQGEATIGDRPPETDVHSRTLTVPSGFPAVEPTTSADSYGNVSARIASAAIEGYFPPEATRQSLERSGFDRELTIHRYLRVAAQVDLDDDEEFRDAVLRDSNASAANERLVDAYAAVLRAELEETYDDPEAAATAVSTDVTYVTVQTW